MARIDAGTLERLKEDVSLVRLVEASGVVLEKRGRDHVGCCPFHDDKTPSLVISPQKNLWHCMGACDVGGDVIEWVKRIEGVSFRHAVELLMNDYAPDASLAAKGPVTKSTVQKLESFDTASSSDDRNSLSMRVIDYYHETLKGDQDALAYLAKRGLDNGELIERFKLGLANRTLGYRLPQANRKAGADIRGRLQKIGFMRASGHEHFAGSLVVPVFDDAGQVVEVYGRKLLDNLRKGTPKHLYLPGSHQGIWNRSAIENSDEVILCEALIDAMTFWVAGYRHVTASYGTGGFTDAHLELFRESGVKRVLIAYDRDEAGDKAAAKLAKTLAENGIEAYRVQFPKGMDANEYARQVKPAHESLGVLLRSAEWMEAALSPNMPSGHGSGDPKGSAKRNQDKETTGTPRNIGRSVPAETPQKSILKPVQPKTVQPKPVKSVSEDFDPRADGQPTAQEREDIFPDPSLAAETVPASASPLPDAVDAVSDIEATVSEHEVSFMFGERFWRVRGMAKNLSYETLKLNILVRRDQSFHVDSLDLYAARQRAAFIGQASKELGVSAEVIKGDMAKLLLKLEALQEEAISEALEPQTDTVPDISPEERARALAYLKAPDLIEKVAQDIEAAGVIGEDANALVAYLASVSRKLKRPLAILIQSTSAAGKSALMDTVLSLMPDEERVEYSAMTGQSLYYLGETNLKHKILAIAEEEGVRDASYALKLLQSQGELTIASTGKDAATGKLITQEYHLEGPVALMLTTTAIDLDEELANRCLVLSINETRAQTRAIHDRQRFDETLEGLKAREDKRALIALHQTIQRLLEPLEVVNPFATKLTFLDEKTRTRRDHQKYLALIRAITLLHQHQRPVKQLARADGSTISYIEATEDDIAVANRLAHMVLGRTLDELPPQTRTLLTLIDELVTAHCEQEQVERRDYRFTRREIREATLWGNTQLKVHLKRLEELEYLIVHRGGRGQSFVYELAYQGEGQDGQPFLLGLQELETQQYDGKKSGVDYSWSGEKNTLAGWGRPAVGRVPGAGRPADLAEDLEPATDSGFLAADSIQDAQPPYENERPSGRASQLNGGS